MTAAHDGPTVGTVRRRALVTGGSRGIGREIALGLSRAGHDVVIAARTRSGLEETARRAEEAGSPGRVEVLTADFADRDSCRGVVARAADASGGPIEILVHAAGVVIPAPVAGIDLQAWDTTFAVNLTAGMLLAQEASPSMVSARWGRIVTIGSLYSRVGAKFSGTYAASKHAVLGLTRVLAVELAKYGVTANCVLPGFTDTEMMRDEAKRVAELRGLSEDEAVGLFLRQQPLGRLVRPDEVAALCCYLCSEPAAAVTGQALVVDGGAFQST